MPKESDVSVGAVAIDIEADTTSAEKSATGLAQKITEIGNRAGGSTSSGFNAWGTNAANNISKVTQTMSALNSTFGEGGGPLAGITGVLSSMATGFDIIRQHEEAAETAGHNFINLGPGLLGLGAIVTGLGGAFTALSTPLQHAQAELQTAVQNTGKNMSDFSGQFDAAERSGAKFGFTTSDIQKALAELTVETKNPQEALNELTMTETVAAARHTDLGHAARYMGQAHAGLFRVFRQFGIEIQGVKNPEKELESAHNSLATATDNLQKKQQSLADFNARVQDEQQKNTEKYTQAVQDAQDKANTAAQHYSDLQQQYALQDQMAQENAARAAEDAAQRKIDADQKVADLEATLAGTSASAQDKRDEMAMAEMRVNDARVRVAETSGTAQQSAIEQLAQAQMEYNKLQRDDAAQTQKDQQDLTKAKQDQAKAGSDQVKAAEDQTKANQTATMHQLELKNAQDASAKATASLAKAQQDLQNAGQLTLSQQQEQARLTQSVTDAQNKQAEAQAKVAKANDDQNAAVKDFQELEQQFMSREAGLLDRRANTWTGHISHVKATITDFLQTVGASAGETVTKIGSVAMGIGTLVMAGRSIRGAIGRRRGGGAAAGEEETAAREGAAGVRKAVEEGAGATEEEGSALAPIGKGAENMVQKLKDHFGSIVSETEDMGTGVAKGAEKGASEIGRLGRIGQSVTGGFSAMAGGVRAAMTGLVGFVTSPVGLVILAIGGLILIGVEVATHWKTISHDLAMAWDGLFNAGKVAFGAIESFIKTIFGFIKGHFIEIAAFMVGGPFGLAIAWIATHWHEVWQGVLDFFNIIRDGILNGVKGMIDGILSGVDLLLSGLSKLPGPFGAPFKEAKKHVDDFRKDVNTALDGLKSDTDKKSKDIGVGIAQGVGQGITQGTPQVQQTGQQLTTGVLNHIVQVNEIHSPSRLFARQVGLPIAQGVAQGMSSAHEQVRNAGAALIRGAHTAMSTQQGQPFAPSGATRDIHAGAPVEGISQGRGITDVSHGGRVIHYEPHFHEEIDPLHVVHEMVWNVPNAMVGG